MKFFLKAIVFFCLMQDYLSFAGNFIQSFTSINLSTQNFSIESPTAVLMHNIYDKNIWLIIDKDLRIKIKAKLWASVLLTKANYNIICVESTPGHEQRIPCINKLAIYTKAIKVENTNIKNMLLVKNKSLTAMKHAIDEVQRKNINENS